MSALDRILPPQADNGFTGHRAALWLLGAYVALKLVMSSNSILNTAGFMINAALLALLVLTLALSLLPVKRQGPSTRPQ